MSPECKKNVPSGQWFIDKARAADNQQQSHANVDTNAGQAATPEPTQPTAQQSAKKEADFAWRGLQCADAPAAAGSMMQQHNQFHRLNYLNLHNVNDVKSVLTLDSGSTTTALQDRPLVTDLKPQRKPLTLATSGGNLTTHNKGAMKHFGGAWVSESALANVMSFAEMEDRCRVTCDSAKERAFVVHRPDGKAKFNRTPSGLHCCTKADWFDAEPSGGCFINTVEENSKFCTNRQLERAKWAHPLCHALGTPSVADFEATLKLNATKNCPVLLGDVKLAEQIFGPDLGALKGKTTRATPAPAASDQIKTPPELVAKQHNVTLRVGGLQISGLKFLTTTPRSTKRRTAECLAATASINHEKALNSVFRVCNQAGFRISTIQSDNEFAPLMATLQDRCEVDLMWLLQVIAPQKRSATTG